MNEQHMKRLLIPFTVAAMTALIAGCGQSPQQPASARFLPQTRGEAKQAPRPGSWMSGDAKSEDLLYVSNGNAEVTVYQYWRHKLLGVLTSFSQPMGICVDNGQNVYVADYAGQQVVEYAHGGTKPIATFDDSPDSPYSCWVDPTTGNLAVANDDPGSQQGNIAIWSAGQRSTFADSTIGGFQFCAYDDRGNLFATNGYVTYPYTSLFAWLPKGGTKLIDIRVPGPGFWDWGYVDGLQWDGQYFVVDSGYRLYRESLSHGQAYYAGYTDASESDWYSRSPYGFYTPIGASRATQVFAGMNYEGSGTPEVAFWKYPAGGSSPIATIQHGLDAPFGVAVSLR
jgi:NHL repeat